MSKIGAGAVQRRRFVLCGVFALSACDVDNTPIVTEDLDVGGDNSRADKNADYRLGANDRIRAIVFGQPTLTGEFTVDGSGILSYPLIGNIAAGGLTASELQQTIVRRLSPTYLVDPSVSIEVITHRPFYVIGEVQKPGNYPFVANITALNAVAMAGGFTYRARKNDFYIKRRAKDGRMVRIQAAAGTLIRPGDTLEVNERYF